MGSTSLLDGGNLLLLHFPLFPDVCELQNLRGEITTEVGRISRRFFFKLETEKLLLEISILNFQVFFIKFKKKLNKLLKYSNLFSVHLL